MLKAYGSCITLKIKIRKYSKKNSMMFETEIEAAMHSDINVSGLYCIKSSTGTTIVKV